MSNVKKPEPIVEFRVCSMGIENDVLFTDETILLDGGHYSAIETGQVEAYKDACVREALEQAAKKPREYALQLDKNGWGNRFPDELTAIFNAADNMADRIRTLIPKQ